MEKLVFKFDARSIEEIEKKKEVPIENCMGDSSISTLVLFITKGIVSENGRAGVSRDQAYTIIDEYLKEKSKDDLMFDIAEALVDAGFLPKAIDVKAMRQKADEKIQEVMDKIKE